MDLPLVHLRLLAQCLVTMVTNVLALADLMAIFAVLKRIFMNASREVQCRI